MAGLYQYRCCAQEPSDTGKGEIMANEPIGTWLRVHIGGLPDAHKERILEVLSQHGNPRRQRPSYVADISELAEWGSGTTYPPNWVEGEQADIVTLFCASQKRAFLVRKAVRASIGTDVLRNRLAERIHFLYEEGQEPRRATG